MPVDSRTNTGSCSVSATKNFRPQCLSKDRIYNTLMLIV